MIAAIQMRRGGRRGGQRNFYKVVKDPLVEAIEEATKQENYLNLFRKDLTKIKT